MLQDVVALQVRKAMQAQQVLGCKVRRARKVYKAIKEQLEQMDHRVQLEQVCKVLQVQMVREAIRGRQVRQETTGCRARLVQV